MMEQPRFRSAWLGQWPLSVADALLHALAAWLLPGTWWWQYVPDAVVPVLWTRSMLTNRMAHDRSLLLSLHRLLHVRRPVVIEGICLCMVLAFGVLSPLYLLHALAHVAIDRLTHDGRWQ